MESLRLQLAIHGVAALTVSVVAGLVLWRVLRREGHGADWHLVHASGTARGVLLIALAPIIHLPALPEWLTVAVAWQIIFFVWTSLLAMIVRAFTGRPGFYAGGSLANRVVFVLYALGAVALVPACVTLIVGLVRAS
jgi:hypothetical protein